MSPIDEREQTTVCTSCGTAHHRECWDENRGCSVKSCPQVSRAIDIDLPRERSDKLVLTRETVESARSHKSLAASNPCMRCGKQVPEGELYCSECRPGLSENEDARNIGPILVMLGVLGVLLAWMVVLMVPSSKPPVEIKTPGVTDKADQ
jgi:predicted nucleic acid-binding Zn ribbon protein